MTEQKIRKFNEKRFYFIDSSNNIFNAKEKVKSLKKKGYKYRITRRKRGLDIWARK